MSKTIYFRCINGVAEYDDKKKNEGNVLSFKNEIWKVIESDETSFLLECVEGPNVGWEFGFTLKQMTECFEWISNYNETQLLTN